MIGTFTRRQTITLLFIFVCGTHLFNVMGMPSLKPFIKNSVGTLGIRGIKMYCLTFIAQRMLLYIGIGG